jgi:hypothetical protein
VCLCMCGGIWGYNRIHRWLLSCAEEHKCNHQASSSIRTQANPSCRWAVKFFSFSPPHPLSAQSNKAACLLCILLPAVFCKWFSCSIVYLVILVVVVYPVVIICFSLLYLKLNDYCQVCVFGKDGVLDLFLLCILVM